MSVEDTPAPVFEAKAMIWAKLKGYPWWPAKVLSEENLPPQLVASARPKDSLPIIFYGSGDWYVADMLHIHGHSCYLQRSAMVDYEANRETHGSLNGKRKKHKEAIILAEEQPDSVDFDFKSLEAAGKAEEDENAEATLVYEPTVAKKRKRKAETTAQETKQPAKKKKTAAEKLAPKKEEKTPFDQLLALRHRIQRIFLSDAVKVEEYHRVDGILKQIEDFEDTKIGKVIKRISNMTMENEPNNVVDRCRKILDKWRLMLTAAVESADSGKESTDKEQSKDNGAAVAEEAEEKEDDNVDKKKEERLDQEEKEEGPEQPQDEIEIPVVPVEAR